MHLALCGNNVGDLLPPLLYAPSGGWGAQLRVRVDALSLLLRIGLEAMDGWLGASLWCSTRSLLTSEEQDGLK